MQAWDVYLGAKLIDTVFYNTDCDHDYVRRGLVEHDGYHPNIRVVKVRMKREAAERK